MIPEQFELYLIRHGLAAERGDNYPDDTKRPLTSRGIQRMKREARALNALDVSFDVILTSPLVRTRQTAEAVASLFWSHCQPINQSKSNHRCGRPKLLPRFSTS